MSPGTVYNKNLFIFEILIEAIKRLVKRSQIKVIISTEDSGLGAFRERFAYGEINDDNILLKVKKSSAIRGPKKSRSFHHTLWYEQTI